MSVNEKSVQRMKALIGQLKAADIAYYRDDKRFLEFFAFDLVSDYLEPYSKLGQLQLLERNAFSVVPYVYVDAMKDPDLIRDTIKNFNPKGYAYPVDGLIVEYDDRHLGASLGATGHHENRMIALKWKDDPVRTRFLGIDLATTRTGMVSITGLFEPMSIEGAKKTVSTVWQKPGPTRSSP